MSRLFLNKRLFIYPEVKKISGSIIGVCLALFLSCKKDNSVLGVDVQPQEDAINAAFNDTSTIELFTIRQDSTRSFNLPEKFLGVHQDGVFGQTKADIITRMVIPNDVANINFGSDPQVTSAEVQLAATSEIIGKVGALVNYKVYILNSDLDASKVYYTNFNDYILNPTPIADFTDSVKAINGKVILKIPVNKAFAQGIVTNTVALANNSNFTNTFKGLVIKAFAGNLNPVTNPGVLIKYDLNAAETGFMINYQNGTPSSTKTTNTYRFAFSGDGAIRVNQIKYDAFNGGNSILRKQLNGDSLAASQNVFLKGLGNMRVKLKLPHLLNYVKNQDVAINRAELLIKVDESLNGITDVPRPLTLALLTMDSTGKELLVNDQLSSSAINNYDGNYDVSRKLYRFNIAKHVQAIITKKIKNYGFYLVMASPSAFEAIRRDNFGQRLVIGGAKNPTFSPKLNLWYVPFKK
jgi:hypothetical protein